MILTEFLPSKPDLSWRLARQAGITHAICKCAPEITGLKDPSDIDALRTIQKRFEGGGFTLIGLEGDEFDMQRIKLGRTGRDEDLDKYCRMLCNMGELGISLLCYNFMATIGWYRTNIAVPSRGGAITNSFNRRNSDIPVNVADQVSEAQLWENYIYFIHAVIPQAERCGVKMGLHPDDPPVSPLCGIGRIFTSADAFSRAMKLSDSPAHGITFCQANFVAMGEDIGACVSRFASRIKFIHFRDIDGTSDNFTETFHDAGPTDMAAALRCYHEAGLDVPIRVDHVPTMAGEDNARYGYSTLGRLFAIGYLKGICDALYISTR